jgi:hypothetical protein
MSVADDLTRLRLKWDAEGTPPDACSQILAVVTRHVDPVDPPPRPHTPNEGEWCDECGALKLNHEIMSPDCEAEYPDENPESGRKTKPEPGAFG